MDLATHFQMMARYNRAANERLYEKCAELDDSEYRQQRQGSFGSIHGLLNHVLLADRIWLARFDGQGQHTPPLNQVLFDDFSELRRARTEFDARIIEFFTNLDSDFLTGCFRYTNSRGKEYVEQAPVAVAHFFNHQTHHRGQIHVMLSQTPVAPPSLDLHRIVNP